MSTFGARSDLITEARNHATAILDALDGLDSISAQVTRGKWAQVIDATGTDQNAVGYKAGDFVGNEGLNKASFALLLTAKDAIKATLAANSNLYGAALEDVRK